MSVDEFLAHEGVARKSGRYPWGSGKNPHQHSKSFIAYVEELERGGMKDVDIARGMGISTTQLRAKKAIAKDVIRNENVRTAQKLKETGMSNMAIGREMGLNESSVRALLDVSQKEKRDILVTTANMLKDNVAKTGMLDVGTGSELHIGVSETKLKNAVAMLEEEGYNVYKFQTPQLGTGKNTTVKVLALPDVPYSDVYKRPEDIRLISNFSNDGGRNWDSIEPPKKLDSKRVEVRYAEQGGKDMDGVIQIRRGVDDLSLGGSKYAQVRVMVDGTHYLKGMAMYTDDLPKGVDVRFNTNKSDKGDKLAAMKPLKTTKDESGKEVIDWDNPFGAIVKRQSGVLNIVNEEGAWDKWSKNLSSQMLSKQSPGLAKTQLDLKLKTKRDEFEEIMSLTNPTIRKKLLKGFAEGADSSAIHLKAAALPRQRTQVILPITSLKDHEIYAPNFRDGEKVVLVRYPHGGIFEIPELTVNNRNAQANAVLKDKNGTAHDAVGIHPKVAERLSGADFDGDTVLVIPNPDNRKNRIKNAKPLEGLKDFDPQERYAFPKEIRDQLKPGEKMFKGNTQQLMGDVSNLITDMTIMNAPDSHLARAVRHSMVVIDAEKHDLDYKRSAEENRIKELKREYQGGGNRGAATIISRASSDTRVNKRTPRSAQEGGPIDRETGKLMWTETGETYVKRTHTKDGTVKEKLEPIKQKSTKMAEAEDAISLTSDGKGGYVMEHVYANHANQLKALANDARKSMVNTAGIKYNASANKAYKPEVDSLNDKLQLALRNAPLERQAQLIAKAHVDAKVRANPGLEKSEIKKLNNMALETARNRMNAKKQRIEVTPNEWAAIQAGAIHNKRLEDILNNMDEKHIKELATPRTMTAMPPARVARAKAMAVSGHTQAEIADALGVSITTLNNALKDGES
jgi:DNA-binding CsgD family transcriptional regulator